MYSRRSEDNSRNGGSNSGTDDPPMSRLFIICNKTNTEEDFRETFDKFGKIEEIYCVKDRNTGENKGIVYIKYSKTSEAAHALEEMNGKCLGVPTGARPLKVLVASSRNQGSGRSENEQEKYVRLFVIVPKGLSDDELRVEFSKYGEIDGITMIRDKVTRECKGFAYVKYFKFSHAAMAFENCGGKFRAVFAEPKSNPRSSNNSSSERGSRFDDNNLSTSFGSGNGSGGPSNTGGGGGGSGSNRSLPNEYASFVNTAIHTSSSGNNGTSSNSNEFQLNIICSSSINQDQLWRLFDIIPGLEYCYITGDCGRTSNYATAAYNNYEAAHYARDKIHGFEYPPGQRIIVKPLNEIKSNPETVFSFDVGTTSKETFSSVPLPQPAPLANPTSPCAQRCFIVCVPKALPPKVLNNVFSRFGDLIDVYMLPNKNCGYAKYASEASALKAIEVLHSAEICGVKLKVMEAEEPRDPKRKRYDD